MGASTLSVGPFWTEERAAEAVRDAGGVLFRVGGSVRDEMLGRSGGDRDYVVTGLSSGQMEKAFPEAKCAGKAFSVYRMSLDGRPVEIALARRERKAGIGHKGFEVEADPGVAIEEDLMRRDLTVNAMAVEVLTGRRVDPFGGGKDVRAGVLRAVSGAFAEDPLRVYRVARFAAQLGFSVEGRTLGMMRDLRPELAALSPERVWEETRKALGADRPSAYFEVLRAAGVLDAHFPELQSLVKPDWPFLGGCRTIPAHSSQEAEEGSQTPEARETYGLDSYSRTLLALDEASHLSVREEVRFAALAQGLARESDLSEGGGGRTGAGGRSGRGQAGVSLAAGLCRRLRIPLRLRNAALFAVEHRGRLIGLPKMRGTDLVALLTGADRTALGAEGLACVEMAGLKASSQAADQESERWLAVLPGVWREAFREVNGRLLLERSGLTGPAFGRALRQARARRILRRLRERVKE